jgi:hypothetical protein
MKHMLLYVQPLSRIPLETTDRETLDCLDDKTELKLLLPHIPLFGQHQPAVATVLAIGSAGELVSAVTAQFLAAIMFFYPGDVLLSSNMWTQSFQCKSNDVSLEWTGRFQSSTRREKVSRFCCPHWGHCVLPATWGRFLCRVAAAGTVPIASHTR